MDYKKIDDDQITQIKQTVGDAKAINALSEGVDSSLVTVLDHRASMGKTSLYPQAYHNRNSGCESLPV